MPTKKIPIYDEASPQKTVDHIEVPIDGPAIAPLEERAIEKKKILIGVRDQLRMQLNGIENQIGVIDQLLNPEPIPNDQVPSQEEPGPTPEKGKI